MCLIILIDFKLVYYIISIYTFIRFLVRNWRKINKCVHFVVPAGTLPWPTLPVDDYPFSSTTPEHAAGVQHFSSVSGGAVSSWPGASRRLRMRSVASAASTRAESRVPMARSWGSWSIDNPEEHEGDQPCKSSIQHIYIMYSK